MKACWWRLESLAEAEAHLVERVDDVGAGKVLGMAGAVRAPDWGGQYSGNGRFVVSSRRLGRTMGNYQYLQVVTATNNIRWWWPSPEGGVRVHN